MPCQQFNCRNLYIKIQIFFERSEKNNEIVCISQAVPQSIDVHHLTNSYGFITFLVSYFF